MGEGGRRQIGRQKTTTWMVIGFVNRWRGEVGSWVQGCPVMEDVEIWAQWGNRIYMENDFEMILCIVYG